MTETEHAKGRTAAGRVAGLLAGLVIAAATVIALILVLHIVFVAFETNPDNPIVNFVKGVAGTLAWVFKDLFVPENERIKVLVNFGLAAVVYLVAGSLVASLLRRVG